MGQSSAEGSGIVEFRSRTLHQCPSPVRFRRRRIVLRRVGEGPAPQVRGWLPDIPL
ncbi:hypothetical protein SGFS_068250 [Streptomyces graminofaciens]|uniref:Uncharacterized protein n=1 Tax=Streptomyces graminofaciens TaxID=68212 RepID=A0ABN5VQ19_9ACTN|nr:hypothetical protein SGFS_068250 [Streptomyces graminofaciens]